MAEDTREDQANASAVSSTGAAPKQYPKGLILGKDGKPCRSCNSFASFTQAGAVLKGQAPPNPGTSPTQLFGQANTLARPPKDCPADVETLGRSTWTLLHTIAAQYPTNPTTSDQSDIKSFVTLFSRLYPCWVCAEDFQAYTKRDPVKAGSRGEFGAWLCKAHNEVNRKLGKPEFDCSRWEERWQTGWKDGRCD